MPALDSEIIKWQLRFIRENAGELTDNELNLCSSFEEQFNRTGRLSQKQMIILEEIYKRRT